MWPLFQLESKTQTEICGNLWVQYLCSWIKNILKEKVCWKSRELIQTYEEEQKYWFFFLKASQMHQQNKSGSPSTLVMEEQTGLSPSPYREIKTIIVSHAFSIPQSLHFSRLSPSEADRRRRSYRWYGGQYSPSPLRDLWVCTSGAPWHDVRLKVRTEPSFYGDRRRTAWNASEC